MKADNLSEKAKALVNEIYQPLGHLNCQVNNNKMWDYAKLQAIEFARKMIYELSDLPRIPYNERREQYWRDIRAELQKL